LRHGVDVLDELVDLLRFGEGRVVLLGGLVVLVRWAALPRAVIFSTVIIFVHRSNEFCFGIGVLFF